ncbi:Bug family tripartite tricarboxylate transporter substrate binding protein [Tardiphaga sp. 1201_B9_N1_1]|uniref:Bug family tripartite tricarboxylate transporter substrate binding protein n=1 Tax=unclassified Tardiphaga TaxID=2631404 RepID=UPI003F20AC19
MLENLSRALAVLALSIVPVAAQSDLYPSRPVQIIVPYAAGGTTDILARIAGQKLTELLGKSFLIVNKPGAGGSLGSEFAAKQPADGYTLVMAVESSHAVNPNVYEQRRYDPVKDFAPITNIADVPNVLVVNKDFVAKTLPELIAELQKNPAQHTFGSSGAGGLSHLNGVLFQYLTKTKMEHIPFRGLGPALTELVAGRITVVLDNIPSSTPFIEGGQLRPLAVAAKQRLKMLPDVPTYAELGIRAMNNPSWFGIAAPAGTPAPVIAKLNETLQTALRDPKVIESIEKLGAIPAPSSPVEFGNLIAQQNEAWRKIVSDIGFQKL